MTMKALIYLATAMIFGSCSSTDDSYRVETDGNGTKVLVGKISRAVIEQDSSFAWFPIGYKRYVPEAPPLAAVKPDAKDLRFVLFIGTWCSDSKAEVPKMYKIFDELAVLPGKIELYGVDRMKKSGDGQAEKYGVTKVPTLIVYSGSKEIGRIIEQPREGIEEDLRVMLEKSR
jgi:thiol-disulfide isomerase/thioredoxin